MTLDPRVWKVFNQCTVGMVVSLDVAISRPAELGFVVLGIILPGRAPN